MRLALLAVPAFALAACSGSLSHEELDDHHPAVLTLGAHVANSNTGNVGISFMGTYTSTAPTSTQMCQAAKLLRRLHEDFGGLSLNRTDVKGHRQYGGTSCPGTALYNRIDKILRKARGGCDVQ